MKHQLVFIAITAVALVTFTQCQPGVVSEPKVSTFHNCALVGGSGNSPHLFDVSKIYKCDEGHVEIAGRSTMIIEHGYVYEEELGEPSGFSQPHIATASDYRDYKWCPKPSPSDPNQKEMCGDKPTTCWDGKPGTWDPNWQGYSCVTPDHK